MDLIPENHVNGARNGVHESAKDAFNNGTVTTCMLSYLSKMAAVDIEFNDVTYSVPSYRKESKVLLKGLSGQFKSGELTAILGPSGSGKSTLLNILAGYKCTDIGGSININGQLRDLHEFKKMSCYIMQNDLTQPNLTVFEAMSFAADLKLGKKKSKSQKCAAIDEILSTLRLTKTRNTLTDKLSGGERKRLTIALELVNNPPVLLLDEPTTGLDEISSTQCIDVLRRLAHFGRTIVCSVHTPSTTTFQKFDHVYVMTNGYCIYRDTVSNMIPFLRGVGLECPKHYNPADFIIEIASSEYGHMIEQMVTHVNTKLPLIPIFRSKSEFELEKKNPKVSWIYQFTTLTKRMVVQYFRNRNDIYLKLTLHIFLGIMIGSLFLDMGNDGSKALFNFGFCFACLMVFLYLPMMPVLLQFPTDILVMKREHFNRWYDLSAYYMALTVISIPPQIFFTCLYLTMVYFITGQPLEWQRISMFFGTCILCAFIAETIGYNIACIFNVVNSTFAGPSLSCPMILIAIQDFSESIAPRSLYRTIFMYMSYLRYGLEGLVTTIYGSGRAKLLCPPEEIYCHFSSPKQILRMTGTDNSLSFWVDILALFVILFIYKGTLYFLLKQRVQPNKIFQMIQLVIVKLFKNRFNI